MDEKHETTRLTIVAILFAIVFGIKQLDLKYDKIGTEMSLDIISEVFIDLSMGIFIVYVLGMALNQGYKSKLNFDYGFFYDFGVTITILIVAWSFVLLSTIYVMPRLYYPHLFGIFFIVITAVFFLVSLSFISKTLDYYILKWGEFLDEKIKKIKNKVQDLYVYFWDLCGR